MDGNHVVHDISSDDDVTSDWAATEGRDNDIDWNNFFVNPESDAGKDQNCDKGYDSDDVVVVGEVLPKPKRAKKASTVAKLVAQDLQDDDDCVVLDGDPDKPAAVEVPGPDSGGDSDDLVIVAETGQVACRDYPHPRHLCVKFPFDSTQHSDHCKLCHCYVCDSPAPCGNWGNGILIIDHCHANEKEELWKSERKRAKLEKTAPVVSSTDTSFWRDVLKQIPTPAPPLAQNSGFRGQAPSFGLPNIIRSQRTAGVSGWNSNSPSRQLFNPCGKPIQRARGINLGCVNPAMWKRTSRPLVNSSVPSRASNSSLNNFRNAYASNLAGIRTASAQANVRHLHEFHVSCVGGAVNSSTIQSSSTVSASHISQGQVHPYTQPTAYANSISYLQQNGNGNENETVSAPLSSSVDINKSQSGQSLEGVAKEMPIHELTSVFPEIDTQFLKNLPPFDFEDEHPLHDMDQLWQLL